jgi:competence protein ComEA
MNRESNHRALLPPIRRLLAIVALCALIGTATATWLTAAPASAGPPPHARVAEAESAKASAKAKPPAEPDAKKAAPKKAKGKQSLSGKLNLNTATEEQLQMLPGVGPSKAERVLAWRKKNGAFKRVADLRKVKGFGYKTLKKLEAFLDVKGDTTLAPK